MLQKLFTFLLLLTSFASGAQNLPAPPVPLAPTDFSAIGSPLPPFLAISQETVAQVTTDTKFVTHLITDKMLKNDANLFVMVFSPICDHCENQAMLIEQNIALFKKSNIMLLCGKPFRQYLNNFLLITHKKDYPKVNVGVDSTDFIKKVLVYDQLPQLNIYDHDRKLIKTFSGQAPIDSFKKYIE